MHLVWDEDVPLFPWWGYTLVNSCRDMDMADCPDPEISIYIFDLFGNLVADPQSHPNTLHRVLDAQELWGSGQKYAEAGLADLKLCMEGGVASNNCPLYWNALNKKGRLVAPGGYLVKRVITDKLNPPVEVIEKLIIRSQAK
jgi:hypothetical protein